jgi:hypothetical protein
MHNLRPIGPALRPVSLPAGGGPGGGNEVNEILDCRMQIEEFHGVDLRQSH